MLNAGEPFAQPLQRFLLARLLSQMAWQMQFVAVGWYVYALTGSALDLGLIGLVQFAPIAALSLFAGHFLDQHPQRTIVMTALVTQSLLSLGLVGLALWESRAKWAAGVGAMRAEVRDDPFGDWEATDVVGYELEEV